jgi:hypothetical protein
MMTRVHELGGAHGGKGQAAIARVRVKREIRSGRGRWQEGMEVMQAVMAYWVGLSPAYDHQMVARAYVRSTTMARAEAIRPAT